MRITPEELEARLDAVLREQPLRRAPDSLSQRVLAEIARRESRPWWQKNYTHWPAAVRMAFMVLSLCAVTAVVFAAMLFVGGNTLGDSITGAFRPVVEAFDTCRAAAFALTDLVRGWLPSVSPIWIYGGLAAAGAAYATLVGLGATAYRLLQQPR